MTRVLLIEDNLNIQENTTELLEFEGYDVEYWLQLATEVLPVSNEHGISPLKLNCYSKSRRQIV